MNDVGGGVGGEVRLGLGPGCGAGGGRQQEADDRVAGTCARCQTYTEDAVSRLVESGSGPGGILVLCGDAEACIARAPAPHRTGPR